MVFVLCTGRYVGGCIWLQVVGRARAGYGPRAAPAARAAPACKLLTD